MIDDWKLPWSASCLCGRVQMKVTAPPMLSLACHCRGCQKLTSSAYSMAFIVPSTGFEVTQGKPVLGGLRGEHRQYYCDDCKTWLFTRPSQMDTIVNIRSTLLDDARWVTPFIDIETKDKLPNITTGAEMSFEGTPPIDDFMQIVADYAERGVRPS